MNNDFKQKLQEREFAALKDEHRVILKWATGCGKSKMAIDLLCNTKCDSVLLLVGETAHKDNWKKEFMRWSKRGFALHILCYRSLQKVKNQHFDAIVLDECHHACAPKTYTYLEELGLANQDSYVYLLSATLSPGKQDMIEDIFGKFKTSTVTLKDAIEGDILPDPKVYVVGMALDNRRANQAIQVGSDPNAPLVSWEKRGKYIYNNKSCVIKCTEHQKYVYFTDKMEYWKQRYELSHNQFHHNLWVNTGSLRKRFLGEAKTTAVRMLLSRLPINKRYVCFCTSVAQAECLCANDTISSKKSSKHNQKIIDSFNNKERNSIYAIGMITEGMNLTDIQLGIIVQLDGKERLFIQKIGRVLRADSPKAVIFYYKDTQDEKYLKLALENIDAKYIQHIDIKDLNKIKL